MKPLVEQGLESDRAGWRASPRRSAVAAVVAFVLLTLFATCVVLALVQVEARNMAFARFQGQEVTLVGGQARANDDGQEVDADAETANTLLGLLPAEIDGYRTAARHGVPGLEGAVEAIYVPRAEAVAVHTPLNCYVMIRIPDGEDAADSPGVESQAADSVEPIDVGLRDGGVSTVMPARSALVTRWSQAGYLVTLDTRFTVATPVETEALLREHSSAVGRAVAMQIGR